MFLEFMNYMLVPILMFVFIVTGAAFKKLLLLIRLDDEVSTVLAAVLAMLPMTLVAQLLYSIQFTGV